METYKIGSFHENVIAKNTIKIHTENTINSEVLGELKSENEVEVWYIEKDKNGVLWGSIGYNNKIGHIKMNHTRPKNKRRKV